MFEWWLSLRLLRGGSNLLGLPAKLSLLGLILGVAVLLTAMAVVSGFERSIRESVIDLSGHVVLIKRGSYLTDIDELSRMLRQTHSDFVASPFLHAEAMLAHEGKVSGIMVQGIEPDGVRRKALQSRILSGSWMQDYDRDVLLGKELGQRLGIAVGDSLRIVVPKPSSNNSNEFQPRLTRVRVVGFVDLGKYEYNERLILAGNALVQKMLAVKEGSYSGLRMMLPDPQLASQWAFDFSQAAGYPYVFRSWYELNLNFFEALKIEKVMLFLVLSVMLVAASFNTASSLYISVVKRYRHIAILKTLGMGPRSLQKIFSYQGLLLGLLGTMMGVLLGLLLVFLLANYSLVDMPADIYKIERLPIFLHWSDILWVSLCSLLLSFFASLLPARKAARSLPVEGLRYE